MDKEIEMIFAPLKQAFESQNPPLGRLDFHAMIDGFQGTNPDIAHAMRMHTAAIERERDAAGLPQLGYPQLISELYWRTFFDLDYARLYGTEAMLLGGPELLQQFATFLIASLGQESMAGDAHDLHAGSDTAQ